MKHKSFGEILKDNFNSPLVMMGGFGAFLIAHISFNQALIYSFSNFIFRWITFFIVDMSVGFLFGWGLLLLYSLIQFSSKDNQQQVKETVNKRSRNAFSQKEDEIIIKNYPTKGYRQIGSILGRSRSSVRDRVDLLKRKGEIRNEK